LLHLELKASLDFPRWPAARIVANLHYSDALTTQRACSSYRSVTAVLPKANRVIVMKILVVDDDAFIVEAYSRKLLQAGFEVKSARDGLAAIKLLSQIKPQIVVLDLMLPQTNGFEVLNYIRAQPQLKETRVVVLSNFYLGDSERQAAAEQANATLMKSKCTPTLLLKTINELTRGPAAVQTNEELSSAARDKGADMEAEAEKRREFLKDGPITLATLRQMNDAFVQTNVKHLRSLRLQNFSRKVHFVAEVAGLLGLEDIALEAAALEALLTKLEDHPESITPSILQTIAYTLDFLRLLYSQPHNSEAAAKVPAKAFVLDDDAVSGRAVAGALSNVHIESMVLQQPSDALEKLQKEQFGLILLDIEMPEIDGLELCKKVRAMPQYRRTPIIFVTGHADFESRINSVLSGGDDLISKPIFPIELAVKAVTHLLRSQLPE